MIGDSAMEAVRLLVIDFDIEATVDRSLPCVISLLIFF